MSPCRAHRHPRRPRRLQLNPTTTRVLTLLTAEDPTTIEARLLVAVDLLPTIAVVDVVAVAAAVVASVLEEDTATDLPVVAISPLISTLLPKPLLLVSSQTTVPLRAITTTMMAHSLLTSMSSTLLQPTLFTSRSPGPKSPTSILHTTLRATASLSPVLSPVLA